MNSYRLLNKATFLFLLAGGAVAPALGQNANLSVTVDNVYAAYFGSPASLTFLGGDGSWNTAESYTFSAVAGSFVYVAAWDQGGLQGFQGVASGPAGTFRTNLTDWVATVVPASSLPGWSSAGTAAPNVGSLQTALAGASWQVLLESRSHGAAPWGGVVSDSATQWVWSDSIEGGTTDGKLVVFRTASPVVSAIPEPSTSLMMLVGLGVTGLLVRRRLGRDR
ncbi:MAG TPA: PEP-CTERM sorting domain-containing protein [Rubrivivax sp.]|nr:PEP-CTERM sorting domain-containing protein [Rubrivivax sp.]